MSENKQVALWLASIALVLLFFAAAIIGEWTWRIALGAFLFSTGCDFIGYARKAWKGEP